MRDVFVRSGLVVLGGALGVLAFVGYGRIWPLSCWLTGQKPCPAINKGSSANDSPATAHGGSFSVHGDEAWTVSTDSSSASSDLIIGGSSGSKAKPDQLALDGVYPYPLVSGGTTNLRPVSIAPGGDWAVVLDYRNKDESEDQTTGTTLTICTSPDEKATYGCDVNNTPLKTTAVYLISSRVSDPTTGKIGPSGRFTPDSIDRAGTVFYDLKWCDGRAAATHSKCDHPFLLTVHAFLNGVATDQAYRCLDGACTIGIDHQ